MKSIRRCQHIMSLFLVLFIAGMVTLVVKIQRESAFYMMNSDKHVLGMVYDRNGDVLFDGSLKEGDTSKYEDNYFIDVGNLIGDDKGQMTNTLVAKNIEKLNNYSFSEGVVNEGGKAAIYTTLDHKANRTVYNAFAGNDGCAVAYNYKTGEILVCTSLPSLDVTKGYSELKSFREGTLMSKNMSGTVPGSTQKVSTVISALEIMGPERLLSKTFSCSGKYTNKSGKVIDCHELYGHGDLTLQQAVEKSCNPYFAQLVEDPDLDFEELKKMYTKLGYAVNGAEPDYIDIDGIECQKASTNLTDPYDFQTQWGCMGQGDTLVSPIQLMMWQSAVANGTGKMTMPHLIKEVTNVKGKITETASTSYSNALFSEKTADSMKQILLTNGANNYTYLIRNHTVGVKSGTAQVQNGQKENSLLVGFVTDPELPVAFCVVVEDRNNTYLTAEYITQVMLDALTPPAN
ncbi:penicillin-binding transpeptidase domain-containing protein [uncultured Ruminococcus sp.]|uniref:penicillin-binding transpeptidase domain-containing protein n=1 Tax=uncultured Ruminococcus sp. TaxID=165186 RepID=UPI0026399DC2|nr:penicillin-binding transpeptidase domain-containing protein [uncultured Ruminococcus sp.]